MQKINFQNLPSTSTPLNATNLNAIQEQIYVKTTNATSAGWYRIAKISGTNHATFYLESSYFNDIPTNVYFSVLTTYSKAKISQLNALKFSENNPTISKLRVQQDIQNDMFYIDCYYEVNNLNVLTVRNENIIDESKIEVLTPAVVTTEYTTRDEITINY